MNHSAIGEEEITIKSRIKKRLVAPFVLSTRRHQFYDAPIETPPEMDICQCPIGTFELSPPIDEWVGTTRRTSQSREGTEESSAIDAPFRRLLCRPLRDLFSASPPSVETAGLFSGVPAGQVAPRRFRSWKF
jgi:hypothetical protein